VFYTYFSAAARAREDLFRLNARLARSIIRTQQQKIYIHQQNSRPGICFFFLRCFPQGLQAETFEKYLKSGIRRAFAHKRLLSESGVCIVQLPASKHLSFSPCQGDRLCGNFASRKSFPSGGAAARKEARAHCWIKEFAGLQMQELT